MNARDIIKLAAQLYVYDALKKKITILTNIQKGKDINVDIFLPKVTDVKVERSIKTSFTEESNQLFFNYKGYQYNLFPGDFLIFEYNEFIDGFHFICVEREKDSLKKYRKCNSILFLPTSKVLDPLNPKDAIEANAINFLNESCQALGILVDLNKKRLATCKKCGKTNKECFPTTIEEYDMYIEMLCENCLTEILDKKITAIKPKKIE